MTSFKAKGFVVFSVEDNGIGVADEHQEKVFEKSSRLNKDIDGTGMGLHIIKKMVESHGGNITLNSTLKKGSTFQVFLKDEPS